MRPNLKIVEEFSFLKGYNQVQKKDLINVRVDIMNALGLTARQNWYFRLRGSIEPRVSEARKIEEVFEKYGVTDIWGAK